MPASVTIRAVVALASFTAAAVAAWSTAQGPGIASSQAENSLTEAPPAAPHTAPKAKAASKPTGAAATLFERTLLDIVNAGSTKTFSGALLAELCVRGQSRNHPPSCPGLPYARRWAEHAPAEMFAWFQKQGGLVLPREGDTIRYAFVGILFEAWAARDSAAAVRAALQCADTSERPEAVTSIIRALRRTDPARAASVAAEHLSLLAGTNISFSTPADDGQEVWNFLCSLPAGRDRNVILSQHLSQLVSGRSAELERLWKSTPAALQQELINGGYAGYYLKQDDNSHARRLIVLEGAADMQRLRAEQTGDRQAAAQFVATGAMDWAERDPAAAVAWTQEHLKGQQRVKATAQMFFAGASGNFDTTLQVWQDLPEGVLRARAAGNLAAGAPPERLQEVNALLDSLSPGDRRIAQSARENAVNLRERLGRYRSP